MSLVDKVIRAGADPVLVQQALTQKASPIVQNHRSMQRAMRALAGGGKRQSYLEEMKQKVHFVEYDDEMDDSIQSGWTIKNERYK